MLFNSLSFLIFFPFILLLFYFLKKEYRWILLLAGSILFYMAWKQEYIFLILTYVVVNYFCAIKIEQLPNSKLRKYMFLFTVLFNLGILFVFKYFNFFNENLNALFSMFQLNIHSPAIDLILPMGISFYTFQVMSYTIDVYKNQLKAERHFGIFFLFVTFFPQLVAGPIERAGNLITQLRDLSNRIDSKVVILATHQIIVGFFKKLVIADRLSPYVDQVYAFPEGFSGLNIALATFFFTIQIYCDFSGYSDIAIGSARLLGVKLMDNFKSPYLARSVSDFWSRWHISLSTWFRDYVYIPLGGNRVIKWKWYYNLFITFIISGFWHGANWTFIVWGALHGIYLVFANVTAKASHNFNSQVFIKIPGIKKVIDVAVTFVLVYFAWVFFRAENISDAILMIKKILTFPTDLQYFTVTINDFGLFSLLISFCSIGLLLVYEFINSFGLIQKRMKVVGIWSVFLFSLTLIFGVMGSKNFIYFQF